MNSEGRVKQFIAREYFKWRDFEDLNVREELTEVYATWKEEIDYLIMKETERESLLSQIDTKKRIFAVKGAKRGNDIYVKLRIKKRLEGLHEIKALAGEGKVHGLFITLTCDPSQYAGVKEAWEEISERWNRFISWLRRDRKNTAPRVSHKFLGFFRVYEATKKGYPHIHAILFFSEKTFLPNEMLEKQWRAFTWIKQCRSVNKSIGYLIKYLAKSFTDKEHMLTPSMLWVFGMRSFGVSNRLIHLIQCMHNSNAKYQSTLEGGFDSLNSLRILGICSREKLHRLAVERSKRGVKIEGWYVELDFFLEEEDLK